MTNIPAIDNLVAARALLVEVSAAFRGQLISFAEYEAQLEYIGECDRVARVAFDHWCASVT